CSLNHTQLNCNTPHHTHAQRWMNIQLAIGAHIADIVVTPTLLTVTLIGGHAAALMMCAAWKNHSACGFSCSLQMVSGMILSTVGTAIIHALMRIKRRKPFAVVPKWTAKGVARMYQMVPQFSRLYEHAQRIMNVHQ